MFEVDVERIDLDVSSMDAGNVEVLEEEEPGLDDLLLDSAVEAEVSVVVMTVELLLCDTAFDDVDDRCEELVRRLG